MLTPACSQLRIVCLGIPVEHHHIVYCYVSHVTAGKEYNIHLVIRKTLYGWLGYGTDC